MDRIVNLLYIQAMEEISKYRGHSWKPPSECGISIINASEYIGIPHRITGKIQHEFWVLDYCFGSGGKVRVGSAKNPWENRMAATAHLYRPCTSYWEDTRATESATHSAYICFNMSNSKILLPLLDNRRKYARISDPDKILVNLLLKAADVGQKDGDAGFWKAQSIFFEILDYLLGAERVDDVSLKIMKNRKRQKQEGLTVSVREYLRQNVGCNVTLGGIARYVGVSISTLTHSYPKETGETPLETHEWLRINEIKNLLLKGEPLKVIAKIMDFNDIYHLSKYFKRVEGVSPKKFLRKSLKPSQA